MARSDAVWGIDIGQCSLKALRCRAHDDADKVVAEAFDYIEYPKILSQAGAEPTKLINEALKQFLSRNSVQGDRVAISVSGQSGLARFIKLPPVEAKKIPDIVRYEARQQIPFDLNDVIWDYQQMGGGAEEEGFALETEIGLFAMKRDAVFRALEPFQEVGIEIDFVQLTPLALYNFLLFDQLTDLPSAEEYDPENPPDSVVILSLGTDATDLVVTNGFRVWQRSIPLGGSHFTKALTKELKLTYAKAEHLKRNAASAQDPKALFQAMRPVFGDLLTELQRSIGYFTSIDRHAKISHVVGLGNAMKLPGLRKYLAQSLGFEVQRLEEFRGLEGAQVVKAPAFEEHAPGFGVCYGLAVQGLGRSGLKTNLLPHEIVKDRLVRQKKPWALAAAAVMLLGCAISFAAHSLALGTVDTEHETWKGATGQASTVNSQASGLRDQADEAEEEFETIQEIGEHLMANVERRILWAELLKAVNECLPKDEGQPAEDITLRNELHITNLEAQYVADLAKWFKGVKHWYKPPEEPEEPPKPEDETPPDSQPSPTPPAVADTGGPNAEEESAGPSGAGWIVALQGYHFHNRAQERRNSGADFVRNTLIKNLHTKNVELPTADGAGTKSFTTEELGIRFPVLVDPQSVNRQYELRDPNEDTKGGSTTNSRPRFVPRFDFIVHFRWEQKLSREPEEEPPAAESDEALE